MDKKQIVSPWEFYIEVSYEPRSQYPERIFDTTSNLIKAFRKIDLDLIEAFPIKIRPLVELERIEAGSLITWLRDVVEEVPDDVIKSGDWKKLLGHYLLKGKYKFIDLVNEREARLSEKGLKEAQQELLEMAKKSDILHIPDYNPVPVNKIIYNINQVNLSVRELNMSDYASVGGMDGKKSITYNPYLTEEVLNELMVFEEIKKTSEMLLKVKKPDYLGYSI